MAIKDNILKVLADLTEFTEVTKNTESLDAIAYALDYALDLLNESSTLGESNEYDPRDGNTIFEMEVDNQNLTNE